MNESIIWHISNEKNFPIELFRNPKVSISVKNVPLNDWDKIVLNSAIGNLIFLQVNSEEWKKIGKEFAQKFSSHPQVTLTLILGTDGSKLESELVSNHMFFLETPLHKKEITVLIDKSFQVELYKRASIQIGATCLENIGFFDGVFELARKETKESRDTIKALESILEFESRMRKSQDAINLAMERVNELREKELLELHQVLIANKNLDVLREHELKDAIEVQSATEAALQFSRIEEMQLDQIIQAQNKLFEFTDNELKALLEENRELKKKLGLL
ncbi:MAG: hypothetical protein SFU98_03980 [Leptospiraceae bacterium]|nr:hypothetical protein [Leptospiraceae bacterium]